jgi:hypothetical protein
MRGQHGMYYEVRGERIIGWNILLMRDGETKEVLIVKVATN